MTSEFERELLRAKSEAEEASRRAREVEAQNRRREEERLRIEGEQQAELEYNRRLGKWLPVYKEFVLPIKPIIEPLMLDLAKASWPHFSADFDRKVEAFRLWTESEKARVRRFKIEHKEVFTAKSPNQ